MMTPEKNTFTGRSRNPRLLILIGAPGSGKSTFSKYLLRTEENWVRINRDDFRMMQFGGTLMTTDIESNITKMVNASVRSLLQTKTNVVLDATNCNNRVLEDYISQFNDLADIHFKIFQESIETLVHRCEKRNEETGKYISTSTIKRFVKQLNMTMDNSFDFSPRLRTKKEDKLVYAEQDRLLPKALICDLDGTLSLMNGRNPYDASTCDKDLLNKPVYEVLSVFEKQGYHIILLSGREERYRPQTKSFLDKHQVKYHHLFMRASEDYRKDAVIKKEIFKREIQNQFYVEFLLDDRNQVVDMWRKELQLACFQVNYGDF